MHHQHASNQLEAWLSPIHATDATAFSGTGHCCHCHHARATKTTAVNEDSLPMPTPSEDHCNESNCVYLAVDDSAALHDAGVSGFHLICLEDLESWRWATPIKARVWQSSDDRLIISSDHLCTLQNSWQL